MTTPPSTSPASDPAAPVCPRCHRPIPPGAAHGLCPSCLLGAGFFTQPAAEAPGTADTPPRPEDLAPEFPQLEILELLGRGGMGAVYKARQRHLDRLVALKLLRPGLDADPSFAERFAREARALAQLNHPGIVTLHEFGRSPGGLYFIVMEFVDGVNLRQLLAAGRLAPREALAIVPPLCDALQYAHDRGLVHRDIKPENILVDRLGRVKIADFGLAKLAASDATPGEASPHGSVTPDAVDLTEAGKVMGTPRYMAPEQREHPAAVDHRADIYALGVVFYQMLTGELPDEKQLQPPSRRVRLDVRLDEIVLRALEQEPSRRYAAASELKTRIETLAAPAPVSTGLPATPEPRPLPLFSGCVASTYAATVGFGVACELIRGGLSGRWLMTAFLLSAALSSSLSALFLPRASAPSRRVWARCAAWSGLLAWLPVLGFAGFFTIALVDEAGGWNPDFDEAALVALVFLGAFLLPACTWKLWHAGWPSASFVPPPPPTSSFPPPSAPGARSAPIDLNQFNYRSARTLFGLPLLHIASGIDPATGRPRVARGIVAIGGIAQGVFAFGAVATGVFAFGGIGFGLFAYGGVAAGLLSVGGLGLGLLASFAGLALAPIAIGGLAGGWYATGGQGFGRFVVSPLRQDPPALEFFGDWAQGLLRHSTWANPALLAVSFLVCLGVPWFVRRRLRDTSDVPAPAAPSPLPVWLGFLLLYFAYLGLLAFTAGDLPGRLASHFDGDGRADGWMPRATYLVSAGLLPLTLGAAFAFASWLLRLLPPHLINLPHREHWLAPENRAATSALLARWMAAPACLLVVFFAELHALVVLANHSSPPRLPNGPMLSVTLGVVVATMLWVIGLVLRFAEPRADPASLRRRHRGLFLAVLFSLAVPAAPLIDEWHDFPGNIHPLPAEPKLVPKVELSPVLPLSVTPGDAVPEEDRVIVEIDADGQIRLAGKTLTPEELASALSIRASRAPRLRVHLRSDPKSGYPALSAALEACRQAKITAIDISQLPVSETPSPAPMPRDDLARRIAAAGLISGLDSRDQALAPLAVEAAQAGDPATATSVIWRLHAIGVRNATMRQAALALAKNGHAAQALDLAVSIEEPGLRDRTLLEINQAAP